MGYLSTSGRNPKTGSWLFCHETEDISVPKFTLSHKNRIFEATESHSEVGKTGNTGNSLVFPVPPISHCEPIDSDCIFYYSGENLEPKTSRFHDKKGNYRFWGSDRNSKSTPCNSPSQTVNAPKVSCKSVH